MKLHTSKTKHKASPRFFQTTYFRNTTQSYFKNKTQMVLEIISNYILQNQNPRGPRNSSDYFKNKTHKWLRYSFKLFTSKTGQGVPEILSDDFRNKSHRKFPTFFQTKYVLQKPNKRSPRFFATTYLKIKTHVVPEIISDYFKNTTQRGSLRFFKLLNTSKTEKFFQITSKTRDKGSPIFFQTTYF